MRVKRPAMKKKRRRRVLVVASASPGLMRAVQRASLWETTWGQRCGVGGDAPWWEMVEPRGVLEVTDGVLHLCVMAMLGLQFQSVALTVGDEGVIAVGGEQRRLATGDGLDPADDESPRLGVGFALEGCLRGLGHLSGARHPAGMSVQSVSVVASMISRVPGSGVRVRRLAKR